MTEPGIRADPKTIPPITRKGLNEQRGTAQRRKIEVRLTSQIREAVDPANGTCPYSAGSIFKEFLNAHRGCALSRWDAHELMRRARRCRWIQARDSLVRSG
jgi:hypothetical protein